MIFAKKLGI